VELAQAIAAHVAIERAAAHHHSTGSDAMVKVLNARQAGTKPATDRVYLGNKKVHFHLFNVLKTVVPYLIAKRIALTKSCLKRGDRLS
jgi:hypothetical protein